MIFFFNLENAREPELNVSRGALDKAEPKQ